MKALRINKTSITDKNVISDQFNEFLSIYAQIPPSNKNFYLFLSQISTISAENSITKEEFEKTFLLKHFKTACYDKINVNTYNILHIKYIINVNML